MRPPSSERRRAGRALVVTLLAVAMTWNAALGATSASFTDRVTARLDGTTRAACTPTNPFPATLASAPYLPTSWWRFNMLTGTPAVPDLTGHGNTGTVVNTGLTFGVANAGLIPCDTTYSMRQPGAAASTGFVVNPVARTSPTSFTVATWIRSNSLTGGHVLGFGDSSAAGSVVHDRALLFDRAGRPVFHLRTSTGNLLLTGPTRVTNNVPHFLSATFDGSIAKLYVDGALVATSLPIVPAATYTGFWRAGWEQGIAALIPTSRNQANTRQDEIAIWEGRVLTGAEITTLWRSNHW